MNIDSKFVLPDFVAAADPSAFDATEEGAFAVAGYRLDNPAGIWKAASDMISGVELASSTVSLIKQACALFDITPEHFILKKANVEPPLTITDGKHTASFNICDNESLNKAASDLLANRNGMPYSFAHDCAHTINTIAIYSKLSFDEATGDAIRKLAGAATVDFDSLKNLVERRAAVAERAGMLAESAAFTKLASQCTSACPEELVPDILDVVDRFDREHDSLVKTASADEATLESLAYLSDAEVLAKQASERLDIDGFNQVTRGSVDAGIRSGLLYKWAADNGYSISSNSDAESVVALVQRMPRALRQEFANLIG